MKPSGPGLLFVGKLLITVSISLLVIGQSTKTLSSTWLRRKGRRKERKKIIKKQNKINKIKYKIMKIKIKEIIKLKKLKSNKK